MTTQTTIADHTNKAAEYAAGLRALADMIEANPELVPILRYSLGNISEPVRDRDELAALARAGARSTGTVSKSFNSKYAHVNIAFGPVVVCGYINREEVCDAVVVGTETVIEKGPDPDAVAALPVVEREVKRDIIEWRCRPLLADEPAEVTS